MEYFLHRDGQQWGPYDEATLRSMLAAQQVLPTDLIWNEQMPDWATVESVFPTSTPAPIPAPTPMPTPVTVTTPVAAAGKSTATPTEKSTVKAKPDKKEAGNKSSLPKIAGIAVAALAVIGAAVWFFVFAGSPEVEFDRLIREHEIIEGIVRKELDKPEGKITQADLDSLTKLNFGLQNTTDISFMANFHGVTELILYGNYIKDVSPLSGLTQLQVLDLGRNEISSLEPLYGLAVLKELNLTDNINLTRDQIADLQKKIPNCMIEHNIPEP